MGFSHFTSGRYSEVEWAPDWSNDASLPVKLRHDGEGWTTKRVTLTCYDVECGFLGARRAVCPVGRSTGTTCLSAPGRLVASACVRLPPVRSRDAAVTSRRGGPTIGGPQRASPPRRTGHRRAVRGRLTEKMTIAGKLVRLRAIEEDDLPALHEWANDPEIAHLLAGWHFPYSRDSQQRWFSSLKDDGLNQRWAIDVPEAGLVGTANLVDIDWQNRHAFHGMLLGPSKVRRRGLGVDTIMAVMRYAFDELNLARLDGAMIEYNAASIGVYTGKCGWKEEGRMRNWFFRHGRYWDRVVVGVTNEDYRGLLDRTGYWETA